MTRILHCPNGHEPGQFDDNGLDYYCAHCEAKLFEAPGDYDERYDPTLIPAWDSLDRSTQHLVRSAMRLDWMRKQPVMPEFLVGREKDILAGRCAEVVNKDDIEPVTEEELQDSA